MPILDPNKRAAHMENMRAARVARAAAKNAAQAVDTGASIDELSSLPAPREEAPAKRRGRPPLKKAIPPKKRAPFRAKRDHGGGSSLPTGELEKERVVQRVSHVRPEHRPIHTAKRDPTVERGPVRDPHTGRVVVTRNGKTYTRRTINTGDKFHIDGVDIPDGMSYQWIAVQVLGAEQRNSIASFTQNGWEAVPLSRYPGRYAPDNADGPIILDGLMLCERPVELTREARNEEIEAAKQLIRTRNEQFVPRLPEALERRGTGLRAKRSIEGMPTDIGRPSYEMAVDEGLV